MAKRFLLYTGHDGYLVKQTHVVITLIHARPFTLKFMDIEDLMIAGKEHQLCPYYMAKSKVAGSDVIILP